MKLEKPTTYLYHVVHGRDGLPTNLLFVFTIRPGGDVSFSLEVDRYADHNGVASVDDLRRELESFGGRVGESYPSKSAAAERAANWFAKCLV